MKMKLHCLLTLCALASWHGTPNAQDIAATLKSVRGDAHIERSGQKKPARSGDSLHSQDRILTGADGYASIGFTDQSVLALGPRSDVDLSQYSFNPTTHEGAQQLRVRSGSLASISGKIAKASPESVQFNTGTVTLGVRGTQFIMDIQAKAEPGTATHWTDSSGQSVRNGTGGCWQTQMGTVSRALSDCQPDRFVLLPDRKGQVGQIVLQSAAGTSKVTTVTTAYSGVEAGPSTWRTSSWSEAELRQNYQPLLASLPPQERTYVLRFAAGSDKELTEASRATLQTLKLALAQWPVVPDLDVVGHTDTVGNLASNDALSLLRAQTVAQQLDGIPPERLHVSGRGERQLLVKTPDETPEPRNRRVEITLR